MVPDAPDDPGLGEAAPLPGAGEPLLDDAGGLLAGAVELVAGEVAGEVTGVAPGWAEALAVAVELSQIVPAFCLAAFLLALALALAVLALALALAVPVEPVALDVAVVPLALPPGLGLPLPVASPGEGLAGVLDRLDEADVEGAGLDEAGVGVAEAAADDCGHDAIGDGRRCRAAVVEDVPPAPAAAWPPWLGAAGLAALVELLPSKADATDEVSACRNGGTEAMTTPTANTAQARAMAGLIRPIRQSRCAGRRAPASVPLRRPFQRRTMSASSPVLADAGLAWLACAVRVPATRARIRSRPSGRGSS